MRIFTADRKLTPSWDLVRPSTELVKKYIWHVLYLSFLPSLLAVVGLTLLRDVNGHTITSITNLVPRQEIGILLVFLATIWALFSTPAFVYLQVKAVQGEEPSIMECYRRGIRYLLPLIGLYILVVILLVMGFIAFIIPAFFLIRGLLLTPYYIIDQNLGPVQAIKQSYRDSRSVSLYIWGIIGVSAVFSLLGSIVGIIPIVGSILSLAIGYIYIFSQPMRYLEVAKNKLINLPDTAE